MKKIGELALEEKWLSQKELQDFLALQTKLRKQGTSESESRLGQILLKRGVLDEEILQKLLEKQSPIEENTTKIDSLQNSLGLSENNVIGEGRYEVLQELGKGGMGVVQLVKDNLLGRKVARKSVNLKHYKFSKISKRQELLLWRLNQEASITAILEHPNIIPFYEMQQKGNGELQFTMRKVEGETLRSLFKKQYEKQIDYDETKFLSIFLKVCDAVAYSHNQGVIHRDLKPENIMVGEFGEVYVMDWGIAKKLNEDEDFLQKETESFFRTPSSQKSREHHFKTTGGLGTPGYMAPEQMKKASFVNNQADIYALGKILRECFILKSPQEEFQLLLQQHAKNPHLKEELKLAEEPELALQSPLEELVPKDIEAIVQKATEKGCQERYKTVQQLIEDLEKYQKNMQISVREYSLLEILQKWSKRNWKQLSILATVFLAIIGTYLSIQWKIKQKNESNYEKAIKAGKAKIDEGDKIGSRIKLEDMSRDTRGEKIQKWLQAVTECNRAISIYPQKMKARQLKISLIKKKILPAAYLEEDYQLPEFLISNFQTFSAFSVKEQENLLSQVEAEKNKILKQHVKQLNNWIAKAKPEEYLELEWQDFWGKELSAGKLPLKIQQMIESKFKQRELLKESENRLQFKNIKIVLIEGESWKFSSFMNVFLNKVVINSTPKLKIMLKATGNWKSIEKGEVQDFIFEVSQMKEQEILQQLISEIEEGTKFFLEEKQGNSPIKQKEYYCYVAEILGRLENQKSIPILRNSLEKLIQKLQKTPQITKDFNYTSYFFKLMIALGNLNSSDLLPRLTQIRRIIKNPASPFWNEAEYHAKNLAPSIIQFSNKILQKSSKCYPVYNLRGIAKFIKEDFEGAVTDFNETIRLGPLCAKAYSFRGASKFKQEDVKGAIADCNKAILINPQFYEAYYIRGIAKTKQGNFEEAIADFNSVIRINPEYTEAYNVRGDTKSKKGELEEAIADFTKAIYFYPRNAKAYHNRGNVKSKKGELEGAIADYTKAIHLNPLYFRAYIHRGDVKSKKGELEGAIADFNEAILLNPQYAEAYNSRGFAKARKRDFEGAIADYNEAIRLNPQYAEAYNSRGALKAEKEDFKGAIADFNKAIRLSPQYAEAYYNRGITRQDKKNFKGAIVDFGEALRLNPKYVEAYNARGNQKIKQEDFKGAIADYNKAIHLNPKYDGTYNNRGFLKARKGDIKGAIADYNEAIRLNPQNFKAYRNRGDAKAKKGDFEGAIVDYNKAYLLSPQFAEMDLSQRLERKVSKKDLEKFITNLTENSLLKSKSPLIYYIRAFVKVKKGDFEGAVADFDKVIRLNPQCSEVYYYRGNAKCSKKDFKEGIADYSKAILLNPQYSKAYYTRGFAKNENGDLEGAIIDYSKAILLNPQYLEAYYYRGLSKWKKKDSKGAIADFSEAIRLNPQYTYAYTNRGFAKDRNGDLEGAIIDYSKAILLNPQYSEAYYYRGNAKWKKRDSKGAIADFNEAIRLNPQYTSAYTNRGFAKDRNGDLEGAIIDYSKAILLNPQDSVAYNYRGLSKWKKKDSKGAIADFSEAIRLNPQYTYAYTNRGFAKDRNGDLEGAIIDYSKAILLNPQYPEVYYYRGNAKWKKRDSKGAIADFNEAIRLNPQYAYAYGLRGFVKFKKEELNQAISDFNKSIELDPKNHFAYYYRGLTKYRTKDLTGAKADFVVYLGLIKKKVKIPEIEENLKIIYKKFPELK